ncbi:MAG: hypothetical protein M1304_04360 [Candidatus Thermoplasmatota archaeon]|nr:hypothetical protein [Candidatus Thermoplasmatota archaeon]MCL5731774.1 hypothetical protein [Candidatus Thermoplasmatota archaeon]
MPGNGAGLESRIVRYSGYLLIAIAIISFLIALPDIFITKLPLYGHPASSFFIFNITATVYLAAAIIIPTALLVGLAIFSLFDQKKRNVRSFNGDRDDAFYRYLLVFVFIEIIVSEVIEYANPALSEVFPFDSGNPSVVALAYSSQVLMQSILFQLLPLAVAIAVLLYATGKLNLRNFISATPGTGETLLISLVVALIFSIVSGGPAIAIFTDFLSLFVLNAIFLKSGFLRAFLANFSISMINVTASALISSSVGTIILTVLLIYLGFLGAYVFMGMGLKYSTSAAASRSRDNVNRVPKIRNVPETELFIRSACPDCGNTTFHVNPDMSLKCTKCGKEIPRDAMEVPNVRVELRRS